MPRGRTVRLEVGMVVGTDSEGEKVVLVRLVEFVRPWRSVIWFYEEVGSR